MSARRRRTAAAVLLGGVLLAGVGLWRWAAPAPYLPSPCPQGPDEALAELRRGNERFVSCRRVLSVDTAHDADWRHDTARKQRPFAAVLCCSDSRVCPEFIFDQRPGALFEIRNAGNVVDDDVMASLEYAVEHLHVPLVVVLGHKGCGAIEAVQQAGGRPLPAHQRAIQDHMKGIHAHVARPAPRRPQPDWLDWLARENARQQGLELVRESEPLRAAVAGGGVKLVVGLYDMQTGEVELWDLEGRRP